MKSQAWISDYTFSLVLFISSILMSITIITNGFSTMTGYDEIREDAAKISQSILSEGLPADWDELTILRPGVMTGNRINETKTALAMNMSKDDYALFKGMLQTRHEFAIIFKTRANDIIEFDGMCGMGSEELEILYVMNGAKNCTEANYTSIDSGNVVKINRLAVFNSDLIIMEVLVWD